MTYYTLYAVKEAPPPGAVRDERYDFGQLTLMEQHAVRCYLAFEVPLDAVPERGRVFIRRYHGEN
jgi:hypothetical protein